ncbi:MAG: NAD(+)/NADH kinase [Candidatus Hodarchaeales archaeon]
MDSNGPKKDYISKGNGILNIELQLVVVEVVEISQIGIFSQVLYEETIDIINDILSIKESRNTKFHLNPDLYSFIETSRPEMQKFFTCTPLEDMQVDCIISIGGDGTILRIARKNPNIPILSINKGRKGFMTEIEADRVKLKLEKFFGGEFWIEEHKRITATINGTIRGTAINEILITSADLLKPIDFKISVDSELISESLADGIIIATPIGSTGHSLSSGGCVIDPDLESVIITLINPINLGTRPIVLKESREIHIVCSTRINPIKLVFDGQLSQQYTTPIEFVIRISDQSVKFLRNKHFATRLRNHLHPETGID